MGSRICPGTGRFFECWEVDVLRLRAEPAETLWDELLPVEARELPEDMAGIDELLRDRLRWRRMCG